MDIEETRNAYQRATQTFTAKVCACGEPMQPELLNITMFNDTLPRWTIGWLCPYYLHTNHIKRMKDNTDARPKMDTNQQRTATTNLRTDRA